MINNENNITHSWEAIKTQESSNPLFQAAKRVSQAVLLASTLAWPTALAKEESPTAVGQTNNFGAIYLKTLAESGETTVEGKIDPSKLSPTGLIEAFNPYNSVEVFDKKVLLFPNDVSSSIYGGKANLDVSMYTKNGERPMNYFEFPLDKLGNRIAPTTEDISYNINWGSSIALEWWAGISIEDGKLVVKWFLEKNETVKIKVLSQTEELWEIELFVKAPSSTENYNAWNNEVVELNAEPSNSVTISRRDLNETGEPTWEYVDTVHSAFISDGESYDSASLNAEISSAWVNLNEVSEITSLSQNYKVEKTQNWEFTIKTTNWKNPNIQTRITDNDIENGKTEVYVDNSDTAIPTYSTEEIVPIELTLNNWTKTIVNVRISKLPAIETNANEKHFDISLQNYEWATNTRVEWLQVKHNWDGKWYTVKINIWDFTWVKVNTSHASKDSFVNDYNSYNMEVSLNWCENWNVKRISKDSETSNYEVEMTCWEDIIEWTTDNFSWSLKIIPSTSPNSSFEIPVSFAITPESQDNSLKITPSSENPTKQITDPKDPIVLEYMVEGDFEVDEDSLPEGFSCSKVEGGNIEIEIDYISILRNNERWDYNIKWVCNLVSLNNQNRVTSISVDKELYFTPAAEESYALWEVDLNSTTTQNFTSKNNSPFVLRERLEPWHTLVVWNETYTSEYEGNVVIPGNSEVKIIIANLWDTLGKNDVIYEWLVKISYEIIDVNRSSFESFDTLEEIWWEYTPYESWVIGKITYPDWVSENTLFNVYMKDESGAIVNLDNFFRVIQDFRDWENWEKIATLKIENTGNYINPLLINKRIETLWLKVKFETNDWVKYDSGENSEVNLELYWEEVKPARVSSYEIVWLGKTEGLEPGEEYTIIYTMDKPLMPSNPIFSSEKLISDKVYVLNGNLSVWTADAPVINTENPYEMSITFRTNASLPNDSINISFTTSNLANGVEWIGNPLTLVNATVLLVDND